jgi:hypothetical protein
MSAQLATGRWRDLWEASKVGTLDLQPVRISLGVPRFWPAARAFPYVVELAPVGLLHLDDRDEFTRRYRDRLDRSGIDAIMACLEAIVAAGERVAMLCCFEDVTKPGVTSPSRRGRLARGAHRPRCARGRCVNVDTTRADAIRARHGDG